MDRNQFLDELDRQAIYCEGRSPLYSSVLRTLKEDAKSSPVWLTKIVEIWKARDFALGWEAPNLLLAWLHLWALQGDAEELSAAYPSCGGSGILSKNAALEFLNRAPKRFWEELREATLQTSEVRRSIAWRMLGGTIFGYRGLPFHLVELGSSAGLNLIGDTLNLRYHFNYKSGARLPRPKVSAPVLTRTGLDSAPLRLSDPKDRLKLRSCVWADDFPRLERLDRAIDTYLTAEKETSGPRLERCSFLDAPRRLLDKYDPHRQEGLLVFNASATTVLGESDYLLLLNGMAKVLAEWGDRALWVELEFPRRCRSGFHEFRVHRFFDGSLETLVIATTNAEAEEIYFFAEWLILCKTTRSLQTQTRPYQSVLFQTASH